MRRSAPSVVFPVGRCALGPALALAAWAVIPVNAKWVIADINVGVLYIFAISSLMVYGINYFPEWGGMKKLMAFAAAVGLGERLLSWDCENGGMGVQATERQS